MERWPLKDAIECHTHEHPSMYEHPIEFLKPLKILSLPQYPLKVESP